jgi:hypothetical protein
VVEHRDRSAISPGSIFCLSGRAKILSVLPRRPFIIPPIANLWGIAFSLDFLIFKYLGPQKIPCGKWKHKEGLADRLQHTWSWPVWRVQYMLFSHISSIVHLGPAIWCLCWNCSRPVGDERSWTGWESGSEWFGDFHHWLFQAAILYNLWPRHVRFPIEV